MSGFVRFSASDRAQEFDIKQLENAALQPKAQTDPCRATHNESTIRIDFDPAPRDLGLRWPGVNGNDVERLAR